MNSIKKDYEDEESCSKHPNIRLLQISKNKAEVHKLLQKQQEDEPFPLKTVTRRHFKSF